MTCDILTHFLILSLPPLGSYVGVDPFVEALRRYKRSCENPLSPHNPIAIETVAGHGEIESDFRPGLSYLRDLWWAWGLEPVVDHVLQDNMPIQQSLTASVDVGGNWNASVKSDPVTGNPVLAQDASGGDLEDANLLIAGAANLLTTRSDSFVAHFRVRSFRQNTEAGIWDATDPSAIVDERRFVMLIDRSNVNEPGDQPDILFLEEAPN